MYSILNNLKSGCMDVWLWTWFLNNFTKICYSHLYTTEHLSKKINNNPEDWLRWDTSSQHGVSYVLAAAYGSITRLKPHLDDVSQLVEKCLSMTYFMRCKYSYPLKSAVKVLSVLYFPSAPWTSQSQWHVCWSVYFIWNRTLHRLP